MCDILLERLFEVGRSRIQDYVVGILVHFNKTLQASLCPVWGALPLIMAISADLDS